MVAVFTFCISGRRKNKKSGVCDVAWDFICIRERQ